MILRPRPAADNQVFNVTRGRRRVVRAGRGYQATYAPLPGYWRPATCLEVDCEHHIKGWVTTIDLDPTQGVDALLDNQKRDYYIQHHSGRRFREVLEGTAIRFEFEPGQTCFRQHQMPIERDPIFRHRNGSGRGQQYKPMDYDQFFDTFNETSHQLNRRRQDG